MLKAILFFVISLASNRYKAHTLWFDILIKNNKIGYNVLNYEIDPKIVHIKDLSFMEINMLGSTKRVKLTDDATFNRNFSLKRLDFSLKTPEQHVNGTGEVKKDSLIVHFSTGTTKGRKAYFKGKNRVILSSCVYVMLKEGILKSSQDIMVFDPSTMSLEKASITKQGNDAFIFKYGNYQSKITFKNGKIEDRGPMGLITKETTQEEALKLNNNPFALLNFFKVKPDKRLHLNAHYLKFKILGIDAETELNFSYQKVLSRNKRMAVVEISIPKSIPEYVGKIPDSIKTYLNPTPFMQTDNPEIKQLAESITQNAENDREKVQKILDFVYDYLKKEPVVSLPSALDVLHMKKGDCNEHSVLFGALARAAGIPTEITVGLIYQDGAYYYHAWDAVYLGNRWYFVDPIFHEFPASIGHIMLKRGGIDKQSDIISIVGRLKISILKQY